MPGTVACPTCGADGTEYANWVIQETLAKEREVKPKIGLRRPIKEESLPNATQPGEPTGDNASGLPKSCYIHADQPIEAFCLFCKKPICLTCMKHTGYFCSIYCRTRAEQEGMDIPEYAGQERLVKAREYKRVSQVGTAILLALVALFIAYEWYVISGQKPKLKFSKSISASDGLQHVQFVSDHEILLVGADKVSLLDFKKNQPVWSTPLAAQGASDPVYEESFGAAPTVRVRDDGIWLVEGRHVVFLDRSTGTKKVDVQTDGPIEETSFGDGAMMVVSSKGANDRVFTRIELPSGTQQVEQRTVPVVPPRRFGSDGDAEAAAAEPYVPEEQHEFPTDGSTVAQLDVKLIEKKLASVETMKPAQQNKQEFENLQVTQSKEYAEDVLNEMNRMKTGGTKRIDQSRYAVTVRRIFSKDAPPWTSEVTGLPALFSLPSVDVLVAGNVMYVVGKDDQKLWQANLSYPIAPQFRQQGGLWGYEGPKHTAAPCMERGDTLYFFDQGVLSAFDTKSGAARWRIPTVGVSQIQFDDAGMLYVTTTTAGPESIQYSEQVNLSDKVEPIILKVDPANGKILWRADKVGESCHLSGKFIYTTKTQAPPGLVALTSHSTLATNFHLFRLNSRNGKQVWDYSREGRPISLDFHDKEILIQFNDRIEVLSFLAL